MSPATGVWAPVLDGEAAERAAATIQRVALDLARIDPTARQFGPSLAGGSAGFAVFFSEMAGRGDPGAAALARAHIEAAIDAVADEPLPPSVYAGFLSIALAMGLLGDDVLPPVDEPAAGELEDVVLGFLARTPWTLDYDLIGGLVGFGVYALKRSDDAFGIAALVHITRRLSELAVGDSTRAGWFTPATLLPEHQRREYPGGYFNGGLAHGIPGVVGLMGQAAAVTGDAEAARLAQAGTRWLLAQGQHPDAPSAYPGIVDPSGTGRATRLAWCYGDAGLAAALLVAGQALGDEQMVRDACEVLRSAAAKARDRAGVVDAGICHGAAGLGHIYNRFFQATGDELFREQARAWLVDAMNREVAEDKLGGFPSMGVEGYDSDPAFLTGSAGVALALMTGIGGPEPEWDQVLMLSPAKPPPRPRA